MRSAFCMDVRLTIAARASPSSTHTHSSPRQGKLRIEIELVPDFPHAKTVVVTFLEKPIVDFR